MDDAVDVNALILKTNNLKVCSALPRFDFFESDYNRTKSSIHQLLLLMILLFES